MLTDFRTFFTTVFSRELRNKNFLKFSPHLKSVATLPCETWNVKYVDIQRRHIQFKRNGICCGGETRVYGIFCATWNESERRLLSWSTAEGEAVAMHASRKYLVRISSSNRTAHLRTGCVTQSHFYAQRCQTISPDQWPQTAQIWTLWIIRSGL